MEQGQNKLEKNKAAIKDNCLFFQLDKQDLI